MKWSIVYVPSTFADPEMAAFVARTAEEAGFESLWGPEHVVVPTEYEHEYSFSSSGRFTLEENDIPDPLVWFAYAAAVTSRIRFGTGTLILPEHNPVVLAKSVATLSKLARGRIELGVGVGWLKAEFDAIGVPFEERGKRAEDYIAAMRALWRDDVATHNGEYVSFSKVRMYPKPHERRVPIHICGTSLVAARRAARLGDGFFPAIYPNSQVPVVLPELLKAMRQECARIGRDASDIEITSGGTRSVEGVQWFQDQGVHRMTIAIHARDKAGIRDELMRFGEDVIQKTA